jgi:hypothetical protein
MWISSAQRGAPTMNNEAASTSALAPGASRSGALRGCGLFTAHIAMF